MDQMQFLTKCLTLGDCMGRRESVGDRQEPLVEARLGRQMSRVLPQQFYSRIHESVLRQRALAIDQQQLPLQNEQTLTKAIGSQIDWLREVVPFDSLFVLIRCTEPEIPSIHPGCACAVCGEVAIKGIRYSCAYCPGYHTCDGCIDKASHPAMHPFVIITKKLNELGNSRLRQIGCRLETKDAVPGMSWKSRCGVCKQIKLSIFLTGQKSRIHYCLDCFRTAEVRELFLLVFVPANSNRHEERLIKKEMEAGLLAESEYGHKFIRKIYHLRINEIDKAVRTLRKSIYILGNQILTAYDIQSQAAAGREFELEILLEWEPKCLADLVSGFDFDEYSLVERVGILADLALALRRMHGQGLAHGQVSPQVIFPTQGGRAKVQVFPFSLEGVQLMQDNIEFQEPGQLKSIAGDIFSLGLMMNFLLTGEMHKWEGRKAILPHVSKFFGLAILACIDHKDLRPSAASIHLMLREVERRSLVWMEQAQREASVREKNHIFLQRFYQQFRKYY